MLRGAPISDQEIKKLNLKVERLLENCGIVFGDYDQIRKFGGVGYAHYYLKKCWNESELKNKSDVSIYKQLLEIDSKIGTTPSEQLFRCVFHSLRMDLIEV